MKIFSQIPSKFPQMRQSKHIGSWNINYEFEICKFSSYHKVKVSSSYLHASEVHSEPSQISKMQILAKIFNSFQPLTTSTKNFILDDRLGSACTFCQFYRLIFNLYWPEHQKGLVSRENGLIDFLKLIKILCTKLVLALTGDILHQIFKHMLIELNLNLEMYLKNEMTKIKIGFENWF